MATQHPHSIVKQYGVVVGYAVSSGRNCLLHSFAQLVSHTPYDGNIRLAERRCANMRSRMSSTHGCPESGPLELAKWWAPALECLGRRPELYTVICVGSLESGARLVVGAGDTPLFLFRAQGHFAPMWCSNASALATHLISTRSLPDWHTCVGGGNVKKTCRCGARFRAS